ncbi:hypothetical protein [Actinoplanes awajinensis]|uniref:hypothetical protein n=1 Tax=Actinoplanes awajinensis TaxID=135946 RepID=UPI0012FB147A|nr:hypothetical protein [Actinoplanes awajinensis]
MRTVPRALAWASAQAVYVGAWVAAGELSTGKRRLARVGIVAAAYALVPTGPDTPEPRPARTPAHPRAGLAGAAKPVAVAATGVLLMVGRHRLRNRWLAGLARSGHSRPHVALAVRMGALALVISLIDQAVRSTDGPS